MLVTTPSTPQRRLTALLGPHPKVDLTQIRHETLVVGDEADQVVPLPIIRTLDSLIPNAELQIIPAAGHTALLERPEMYSSLVMKFLHVESRT